MGNSNRKVMKEMEKIGGKMNDMMKTPCTITEAVQIARGVSEDVVADYHQKQGNIQLSLTMQLEILRDTVIKAGLITEEEFRDLYMKKAKELQNMKRELESQGKGESGGVVQMNPSVGDVEIKIEE